MKDFKTYIRTYQLRASSRKDYDSSLGVQVSAKELSDYGVKFPVLGIKETIINDKMFCLCTEPGNIDCSLLKQKKRQKLELIHYTIWINLLNCNISEIYLQSEHVSDWFRSFLKFREDPSAMEYYLNVDNFAKRVHSPVTSLHREYRRLLTLNGEPTASLDVAQMQPSLLAVHLMKNIGENSFSKAVFNGQDVYLMLQSRAGLKSRNEAKKRFFEILFARPNKQLAELFDGDNWIMWIDQYKSIQDPRNPHSKEKPHSNLAWLLQNTEVLIMKEVWETLAKYNIPFLTVHDEIIVRQSDASNAETIFSEILSKHLPVYKIKLK